MKVESSMRPVEWYREPMVWLLVAILALALAAGIALLGYARLNPDSEVHSERRPVPAVTSSLPLRISAVPSA